MKKFRFFYIFFGLYLLAGCGAFQKSNTDSSDANANVIGWNSQYFLTLGKVQNDGTAHFDFSQVDFIAKTSKQETLLESNQGTSWLLPQDNNSLSTISFPIPANSSRWIYTNTSQFVIVEDVFRMGTSANQTPDNITALAFDVMLLAKQMKGANAKENVRILYFVDHDIVLSIGSDLFGIHFSTDIATIERFELPAILTNQLKIAKSISAGLAQSTKDEKVLWVAADDSMYEARTTDDSNYKWRGPYRLTVDGSPPGRKIAFGQVFTDNIEDALRSVMVLRDDGIYVVMKLANPSGEIPAPN